MAKPLPNLCFLHIPKTAGTTISFILDYAFNRKSFWDYEEKYTYLSTQHLDLLSTAINSNHIALYGGHVTYKFYQQAIKQNASKTIATIREPVAHFMSKYNHDLNVYLCSHQDQLARLNQVHNLSNSPVQIPYENLKGIYPLEKSYSNTMKNYLNAFLASDSNQIDIDFLIPSCDLQQALQLFFFNWNQEFESILPIGRRDPAFMTNKYFPRLNDADKRKFSVAFSNEDRTLISEMVKDGSLCYSALIDEYKTKLSRSVEKGFKYYELPIAEFKM